MITVKNNAALYQLLKTIDKSVTNEDEHIHTLKEIIYTMFDHLPEETQSTLMAELDASKLIEQGNAE